MGDWPVLAGKRLIVLRIPVIGIAITGSIVQRVMMNRSGPSLMTVFRQAVG